jgi:hypothetical protein
MMYTKVDKGGVSHMEVKERKSQNLGVLMLDFIPVVREGLKAILTKDGSIEMIGDASDGYDAILNIKRARQRRLTSPQEKSMCSGSWGTEIRTR